jgi:ribosomal protein S12 methylthiotransferase
MQEILDEVRYLVRQGIKEFNVIAQELTYYGIDIDGQQHIAELIEQMADIEGVEWIRLHYAYPTHFPWDLLRVMREKPNVCKYLDIALQHISDNMLSRMKRNVSKQETYELVEKLRQEVPEKHLAHGAGHRYQDRLLPALADTGISGYCRGGEGEPL